MKSPTEIKNKVKQLKFEYLKAFYQKHLVKEPQNCFYNRSIVLDSANKEVTTRICTYFTDGETYQICNSVKCSKQCNAFVPKREKKDLKDVLESDMTQNPERYPEILVLNWALDVVDEITVDAVEPEPVLESSGAVPAERHIIQKVKDFLFLTAFKVNAVLARFFQ